MSKLNRAGMKSQFQWGILLAGGLLLAITTMGQAAEPAQKAEAGDAVTGREIFLREWLPNDPRSHGGDGLGPVFNDSSCVACHNQGGAGGGGPASKNVNIVSATFNSPIQQFQHTHRGGGQQLLRMVLGLDNNPKPRKLTKEELQQKRQELVKEVEKIHPGFRTANSVVIHHFGNDEKYENWKAKLLSSNNDFFFDGNPRFAASDMAFTSPSDLHAHGEAIDSPGEAGSTPGFPGTEANERPQLQKRVLLTSTQMSQGRARLHRMRSQVRPVVFAAANQHGHFAVSQSQRNATALFGAGQIDAVTDEVLKAAAKKKYKDYPEVSGRVAMLPNGKIGRFGWKSQKESLRDFTVTACAVELGLHVPEHSQSGDPNKPAYKPQGYDLTKAECDLLINYIRDLPAPVMRKPAHPVEGKYLSEGRELFAGVGCATCHTEDLGTAKGIYSDLLLHDLGEDLGDTGSYGVFLPDSPGGDDGSPVPPITQLTEPLNQNQGGLLNQLTNTTKEQKPVVGATRLEWRTPPLWGVRDSAPYLHDGRAKTLEQAVAMHGGEANKSAVKFFALKSEDRQKVVFFMKSLSAPSDALAGR